MAVTRRGAASKAVGLIEVHADAASESCKEQQANFTREEVAQHSSPSDCWLIIRGKVYNVTHWVPVHPGGSLIYVKAGGDCTQLFDAYHPLTARAVLAKFCIGTVKAAASGDAAAAKQAVQYQEDLEPGQFYCVLKQRVEKYFRSNHIDPRSSASMYIKTALILTSLALFFYLSFFFPFASYWASLACSVLLGAAMAEVGVSIQHDANHGAFSRRGWASQLAGATLDLVGASSFMWRQQHVVGHHAFTNVEGADPDIRVADPDVRRVCQLQPWQPYQAYQHVYLAALYALLAIKSVLIDDFSALRSGAIGAVKLAQLTRGESAVLWGGKALWALLFVALPVMRGAHGLAGLAGLWALSQAVTGWMLALMFQVAHVVPEVEFLKQQADGKIPRGWAAAQVATTADFAHGSWFWTHISGGLNYQVVHHLFPGVCHTHYPALAPIVLDTCREFGVSYQVYPTFWAALAAHFRHLKMAGQNSGLIGGIPSLASIG